MEVTMSYNGIVPHGPCCLSIDKVEEKAIENLQPLIEELEVSAVVDGDWPCEAVHRAC